VEGLDDMGLDIVCGVLLEGFVGHRENSK
jgi:hypothetical protein